MPGDQEDERRGRLRARGRGRRRRASEDPTGADARARAAWDDLCASSMLRRGGGQLLVMDGPGDASGICPLRPLAQVLAARLDLDRLGPDPRSTRREAVAPSLDDLADTLELYRWGDGYADYPGTDAVSGDHNAFVALAALQAHDQLVPPVADSLWLHRAKRTFEAVPAGPGQVELADRLLLATGIERFAAPSAVRSAELHLLDLDDGDDRGAVVRIGASLSRWEVTGDRRWLDRAIDEGAAGLDRLSVDDQLWRAPPSDAAAWFRVLLRVHAAEPRPRVLAELDRYLERVCREGRDPATGRFDAGRIGRSPARGATLDHAAVVQLLAWQAFLLRPDHPSAPPDEA